MTPVRVLHPITRLIVGGAQENTMLTADWLNHAPAYRGRYAVTVVCGPQTGAEGSLIEETRARGVPLTILPELVRQISPAQDVRAFFKLRRMMRQGRYDIVHTHSSKAGVLGRLAARSARVPVVVHTVHGWSFHDQMTPAQRRLYVALEKLGDWAGDSLIVVSPQDIEKGLAQGIGRRQDYTVIRSGVELDRFGHPQTPPEVMRAQLGLPASAPVVGSVTRLSPQKAPLDLVRAYAQIARLRPDAWFVIVGDGSLRGEVEREVRDAGIAPRTLLTGLRRDVPELMAVFDVFVLTSLWEGLPRVLPQAMATGLPIVCTAADGSAEAVSEGVNGFLTPRGDPDALAARAVDLLNDAALRRRLGAAGRARAPEFSVDRMVQQIDQHYQRLRAHRRCISP